MNIDWNYMSDNNHHLCHDLVKEVLLFQEENDRLYNALLKITTVEKDHEGKATYKLLDECIAIAEEAIKTTKL